jgi:hypothetical protein
MKIKKTVSVETLSRRTLLKPCDFLDRILLHDKILSVMRPKKWGWWEPATYPWELSSIESFIPPDRGGSADRVIWVRNGKLKAEGNFGVSDKPNESVPRSMHAREWIHCELDGCPQSALVDYIQKSAVKVECDISFIHFIANEEKQMRYCETEFEGCFINTVDLSFLTSTLRYWLPNLPWATVFGDAYVRMFGMERLLSAPAFKVEKLSDSAVYIQLSPNLSEFELDYASVHASRLKVQAHLGTEAFFDANRAYPLRGPMGVIPGDQLLKALADFRCPPPGTNGFLVPEFHFIDD